MYERYRQAGVLKPRNPKLRRFVLVNKILYGYSCLKTVLSRKNFSALEKVTFTQKYMQCAGRSVDISRMGLLNTHLGNFCARSIRPYLRLDIELQKYLDSRCIDCYSHHPLFWGWGGRIRFRRYYVGFDYPSRFAYCVFFSCFRRICWGRVPDVRRPPQPSRQPEYSL